MRATLQTGEDGAVKNCGQVLALGARLGCLEWVAHFASRENHASAWATQSFVRGGSDNIETIIEWVTHHPTRYQATNVGDVSHGVGAHLIGHLFKVSVIVIARGTCG